MNSPTNYRQYALGSVEMANCVSSPESKTMLLEMAQMSSKLAEQAGRDRKSYERPNTRFRQYENRPQSKPSGHEQNI